MDPGSEKCHVILNSGGEIYHFVLKLHEHYEINTRQICSNIEGCESPKTVISYHIFLVSTEGTANPVTCSREAIHGKVLYFVFCPECVCLGGLTNPISQL